jgi:ABC-type nitrate/sulfonate/bicarbonate transport system substrate-binding protein
LTAALLLPTAALAAPSPGDVGARADAAFDTPKPTRKPRKTPKPTKPTKTQKPTAAPIVPALILGAEPATLSPNGDDFTVGYHESGILGQLPLLLAQLAGYYDDAGLGSVTIVEVPEPRDDLRAGDLDIAVMPTRAAFNAFTQEPTTPAIAGFRNYAGKNGRYGGDVLLATPGLVEQEPATVIAFLTAYIRALQDLSDPESAAAALALIQASDLAVGPKLVRRWRKEVKAFDTFDGGFGRFGADGGLGGLADLIAGKNGDEPDLDAFIADHTLNIAQAGLGLGLNPGQSLVGPPTIADITVGLLMSELTPSPIEVADSSGHFIAAGFDSVDVVDIEQPLLGLLNGELDFAVVDAVDAADGAAQGLPLAAIAGHQN